MNRYRLGVIIVLVLASAGVAQPARAGSTIVVNSSLDSLSPLIGDGCSLREAITNANTGAATFTDCAAGTSGQDTITFAFGPGPATINAVDSLSITQALVIDGSTQPGFPCGAGPCVQINGGSGIPDLLIASAPVTVKSLILTGASGGMAEIALLAGSDGSMIQGNYIGTDGMLGLSDSMGINIVSSSNNQIGGTTLAQRNIISGASSVEINISGPTTTSTGNVIQGNYIGLKFGGADIVPGSFTGISLASGSGANTIGGAAPGAGNLIAGGDIGIEFHNGGSGSLVQGNLIGPDSTGTMGLNGSHGILLDTVSNVIIGGTAPGAGNLISGNTGNGIVFDNSAGAYPDHVLIQGNKIGTNMAGANSLANTNGIYLAGDSNMVGGTAPGAGNLISGNTFAGIYTTGTRAVIQANRIGVNAAGTAALPNARGIVVDGGLPVIGGSITPSRNIVSGNSEYGILLNSGITGAAILGNYIGTDSTGMAPIGNVSAGISVNNAPGVNIGGGGAGEGNVISGNDNVGVYVFGIAASGAIIRNNRIGLNALGNAALPNFTGITLDTASSITIDQNVISGNAAHGIQMVSSSSANISTNIIGADENGTLSIPNGSGGGGSAGIFISEASEALVANNLIAHHQNLSSNRGVFLKDTSSTLSAGSIGNCLVGNDFGVLNTTGSGVIFDHNWWNAASGPSGSGPGTGDPVSADVTFAPFLTAAPAACGYIYKAPPVLVSPAANAGISAAHPSFSWKATSASETQYVVEIVRNTLPDFSIPLRFSVTTGKKVTYPSDLPLTYGVYFWRVRGYAGILTPFSKPRKFFMTALKSPIYGKILAHVTKPAFTWVKIPGATSYNLRVWTGSACGGSPLRNYTKIKTLSFTTKTAMPAGSYSWTIVSSNGRTMPCWTFKLTP